MANATIRARCYPKQRAWWSGCSRTGIRTRHVLAPEEEFAHETQQAMLALAGDGAVEASRAS